MKKRNFLQTASLTTIVLGCYSSPYEYYYAPYYYPYSDTQQNEPAEPESTGTYNEIPDDSQNEQENMLSSVINAADQAILLIGKQGGFIDPPQDTYRVHNGAKVAFVCYNLPQTEQCRTRQIRKSNWENEISDYIEDHTNAAYVSVNINTDDVEIGATINGTILYHTIQVPLGRLFDIMCDIVNSEALTGQFDTLQYSLDKTRLTGKQYLVQKLQPYPDELYIGRIQDVPGDDLFLQFFIQGEPR